MDRDAEKRRMQIQFMVKKDPKSPMGADAWIRAPMSRWVKLQRNDQVEDITSGVEFFTTGSQVALRWREKVHVLTRDTTFIGYHSGSLCVVGVRRDDGVFLMLRMWRNSPPHVCLIVICPCGQRISKHFRHPNKMRSA